MSAELTLNTKEFFAALAEYVAVMNKDCAYALNRQANNLCIKAASVSPPANKSEIQAIQNEEWWPKVVAKVMKKRAGSEAASKIYQAQWAKLASTSGRKMTNEEKSYSSYARKISKALIGGRTKAISFTKWFFIRTSREIASKAGLKGAQGKNFQGVESEFVAATTSKLFVKFNTYYSYKRRGDKTAKGIEKKLQTAINLSLSETVADMKRYVQTQLEKRGQQYSGTR